ncbi:outer membrane beta-barrel protein [Melioribacter sp. Ez-97]|uniref:outer membrane beta-barrel protein n=1 Tax=Melioribacter sp. Ez-97 TaxID=3423434 RepID=UPI003EDACBE0
MKTTAFFLLLLLVFGNLKAQSPVGQGTYTLNGSVSYESVTNDGRTVNYFRFEPQIGYFFVDNLYTAVSLTFIHYGYENSSYNYYGFGPAVRYYFNPDKKLKPFLGAGLTYMEMKNGSTSKYTEIKFSGGVDYFITNYFAIEAAINYSRAEIGDSDYYPEDDVTKAINIGIGVNFFIH